MDHRKGSGLKGMFRVQLFRVPQFDDHDRCTGLCRPLPNHSATAPRRFPSYPAEYPGEKNLRGEADRAQNAGSSGDADLVPGLMARHLDWSPGPLPGLRFAQCQMADSAGPGASRRRSRRRAKRERRSARRLSAMAETSSPLRARRSKSWWRTRSTARWLSGCTLTGRSGAA
jgi:hypothetical protein